MQRHFSTSNFVNKQQTLSQQKCKISNLSFRADTWQHQKSLKWPCTKVRSVMTLSSLGPVSRVSLLPTIYNGDHQASGKRQSVYTSSLIPNNSPTPQLMIPNGYQRQFECKNKRIKLSVFDWSV